MSTEIVPIVENYGYKKVITLKELMTLYPTLCHNMMEDL